MLAAFKLPESLKPGERSTARRWFDQQALRDALATPSIGLLLLAMFVCIFSFANFESTLSLMVSNESVGYGFDFREVCLTFAFIGLTLTVAQGGLVRRLSGRVSEAKLAMAGAVVEIGGFRAAGSGRHAPLAGQLARQPRDCRHRLRLHHPVAQLAPVALERSDEARRHPRHRSKRRRAGPHPGADGRRAAVREPALAESWGVSSAQLPLFLAGALMVIGLVTIITATSHGRDYGAASE